MSVLVLPLPCTTVWDGYAHTAISRSSVGRGRGVLEEGNREGTGREEGGRISFDREDDVFTLASTAPLEAMASVCVSCGLTQEDVKSTSQKAQGTPFSWRYAAHATKRL